MKGIFVCTMLVGALVEAAKLRVLFVGNSFTFVSDMPGQLSNIASSLGDELETASSTIPGCTLFAQQAERDNKTALLLEEDWDYIVLQDYSLLPTVKKARDVYFYPAVEDFVRRKKTAKIVMYLTWGYYSGLQENCPSSDTSSCFPLGTLPDFTEPNCSQTADYNHKIGSFECMGYSLARGYFDAMPTAGADMVAPCGLAWEVVRGSTLIPDECKHTVDSEFEHDSPMSLPLQVQGGTSPDLMLNIRDSNVTIDKHQSVAGCYLNALVFYATLFGKSPLGAAPPLQIPSWGLPQANLTQDDVSVLQRAATGTVEQCGSACGLQHSLITVV